MKSRRIKKQVFIPVSLTMVALILLSAFGFFWLQRQNVERDVVESVGRFLDMYDMAIDQEALKISGLFDYLEHNRELQESWLARDRQRLYELSAPILRDFKEKYRITHFYFHQVDRENFLRVHKPERYGDTVERATMAEAVKRIRSSYGVELGPYGTLTLRVVRPWWINGRLAGYLELGEEISHLTPVLKKGLGLELVFAVDKKNLDRDKWEEGVRMLGYQNDWDAFSRVAIIDSTIDLAPVRDRELFKEPHRFAGRPGVLLSLEDQRYEGALVPLIDLAGHDLGDILILRNVTESLAALKNMAGSLFFISSFLAFLLFGFFYFYLGRVETSLKTHEGSIKKKQAELEESNRKLQRETEERRRATEMTAVMEERGRLARELHDSVTQSLYSLTLFAETSRQLVGQGDLKGLNTVLAEMNQCAQGIMKEFRLLVYDLRPSALEEEGLVGALRQRLDAVERRSGVKGCLYVKRNGKLPAALEEALYRITQEALNNALKHSGATDVSVWLNIDRRYVAVEIADNGIGVDPKNSVGGGMGLANMRERTEKLGGSFSVTSPPDDRPGTVVKVRIDKFSDKVRKNLADLDFEPEIFENDG